MNGVATKAKKDTRCIECGRTIPAGMTFRRLQDKRGMPIGDHCYGKCKAQVKRSAVGPASGISDDQQSAFDVQQSMEVQ